MMRNSPRLVHESFDTAADDFDLNFRHLVIVPSILLLLLLFR